MGRLSHLGGLLALVLAVVGADHPIYERTSLKEAGVSQIDSDTREVDQSYFLPRDTIPFHYFIQLTTNIHANVRTFRATTEIYFNVVNPTSKITMHLQELDIQLTELYRIPDNFGDPVKIGSPRVEIDTKIEHVVFKTESELPIGRYYLKVTYTGTMRNYQSGYLVSSYRDDSDVVNYVGSTHFQATLARRVFPCYDEPDLKATISLWITHHKTYSAIANMPIDSGNPDPNNAEYVVTKFRISPKMSTYLLAFAVTNFEGRYNGKMQVFARSNAIQDTGLALQAGAKILEALDQHTGVPYYDYMPKMTQIAVPDRGTGAMENWGLVTYGEPSLLFNSAVNGYRNRKRVTTVIAHEFAHQWFGNLVSPQWWEYIWLNEGFATLYEYYGTELAYPELEYWQLFNVEVIQRAFVQDASEDIRAMNHPAATQDEVWHLFDVIAYQKSGSVLNMFRQVIGDENWKAALKSYLLKRKLSSAKPVDLYVELQAATQDQNLLPEPFTVEHLMKSWTDAPGYPVLNVRRVYKTGEAILSQDRFLADKRLPVNHVWHIPYNFVNRGARSGDQLRWLSTKAAKIDLETNEDQWVIFNREQFGYYRVNYDRRNWDLIIDTLLTNPATIHRANRAQLIDDAFNLARSDRLDMSVALKLLTYLRHETEYAPWAAANNVLSYFYAKLRGTPYYAGFANFVHEITSEIYATLQVTTVSEDESTLHKYLKQTVSSWACRMGNRDCLDRTFNALTNEVIEQQAVHPDVSAVVYCYGLREGSYQLLSYLVPKMVQSKNQAQRTDLINAMGCTKDAESVRALLTVIQISTVSFLSSEKSQIVDAIVAGGREGIDVLIDYLMNNASQLLSAIGEGAFNTVITNIASHTNTVGERQWLEQLLEAVKDHVTSETVQTARQRAQDNAGWYDSLEGLVSVEFYEKYAANTVY
ncbi:aminopeptidase N [Culex quinquefasciatus]|uniref:aminopeptidase N n=1 Tax=Culex quinquefasciatus TaxID=7176 RepID=UPI0018E31222|nr:aminopeptidase N [Culex quinquefasciatus]